MSPVAKRAVKKPARKIKTRRDFTAASAVAKKLAAQGERDNVAEKRLQSLLHELDRFDGSDEEAIEDSDDGVDAGVRRRWSDEEVPGSD
jgi:hypothetical protein